MRHVWRAPAVGMLLVDGKRMAMYTQRMDIYVVVCVGLGIKNIFDWQKILTKDTKIENVISHHTCL